MRKLALVLIGIMAVTTLVSGLQAGLSSEMISGDEVRTHASS